MALTIPNAHPGNLQRFTLSDMARDPAVKAFFRRGEGGPSPQGAIPAPVPIKPAPAALERAMEVV